MLHPSNFGLSTGKKLFGSRMRVSVSTRPSSSMVRRMLRISSFKAFVISNLLQFVLSMAIGIAATFVLLRHMGGHPLVRPDIVAMLPTCLSVILSSLIAGFIAGRIAEYRPVLHGALSGCFWLIQTLYAALHTAVLRVPTSALLPISLSVAVAFAALLFGALGGYGAARMSNGASRYNVTPVPRTRFVEGGLIGKFLLSMVVTVFICAFIFFSPTIFCGGGGAGGNCGEGYMASIPAAIVLSPFILAGVLFLV
jgi:hypothetical protein